MLPLARATTRSESWVARWWLLGREDRARRAFARFDALVDRLECYGIGNEARRWIRQCCEVAGVELPQPTVIARSAEVRT
jgi:hypothetical protein